MKVQAPTKLFRHATALGFCCKTRHNQHYITPAQPSPRWELVCRDGRWILQINGLPQMRMSYEEVQQFLERRS